MVASLFVYMELLNVVNIHKTIPFKLVTRKKKVKRKKKGKYYSILYAMAFIAQILLHSSETSIQGATMLSIALVKF